MDLEKAKLLQNKLTALKTFIRNVGTIGTALRDNKTAEEYRKIYKDIKETLNDPNLETYAPDISSWISGGGDGFLWTQHQAEIVNSGTRLISYLEEVLVSTFPESQQFSRRGITPANNSISERKSQEIKYKQQELTNKIKENDDTYYEFSVFISHANIDYLSLHELCFEFIENKIKPIVWFEEVKDKTLVNKLCDMIDESDLFLIYLTSDSVISQITNNEIGFVEGKKYFKSKYKMIDEKIVLRLFDKNLKREELQGFYDLSWDGVRFDPNSVDDKNKVITNLKEMYLILNKEDVEADKEKIYTWLLKETKDISAGSITPYLDPRFKTTPEIANVTNLPLERIRYICDTHEDIRRETARDYGYQGGEKWGIRKIVDKNMKK